MNVLVYRYTVPRAEQNYNNHGVKTFTHISKLYLLVWLIEYNSLSIALQTPLQSMSNTCKILVTTRMFHTVNSVKTNSLRDEIFVHCINVFECYTS